MKKSFQPLEERLVKQDDIRKEVQDKLKGICLKIREDADSLEEKISGKISENFNPKEEQIFSLIEKLNEGNGNLEALVEKGKEVLSSE